MLHKHWHSKYRKQSVLQRHFIMHNFGKMSILEYQSHWPKHWCIYSTFCCFWTLHWSSLCMCVNVSVVYRPIYCSILSRTTYSNMTMFSCFNINHINLFPLASNEQVDSVANDAFHSQHSRTWRASRRKSWSWCERLRGGNRCSCWRTRLLLQLSFPSEIQAFAIYKPLVARFMESYLIQWRNEQQWLAVGFC